MFFFNICLLVGFTYEVRIFNLLYVYTACRTWMPCLNAKQSFMKLSILERIYCPSLIRNEYILSYCLPCGETKSIKLENHLGGGPVVRVWDQDVCSLCGLRFEPCGCSYIWWPLEAYMVVNFRARGISRGARKLAWTPTLN
jgi:hypothetical protein